MYISDLREERFIGYGPIDDCPKCKNHIIKQVYCSYIEGRVLGIRFISAADLPKVICGICGYIFNDWQLFSLSNKSSQEFLSEITKSLWLGREETKRYFQKSDYITKEKTTICLKRLKFNDLLNYLKIP